MRDRDTERSGSERGEWTLALARMKVKDVNDNVRPCRSQRLMRFSQSVRPFISVCVCVGVCVLALSSV